jgi:hypothetical protein
MSRHNALVFCDLQGNGCRCMGLISARQKPSEPTPCSTGAAGPMTLQVWRWNQYSCCCIAQPQHAISPAQ